MVSLPNKLSANLFARCLATSWRSISEILAAICLQTRACRLEFRPFMDVAVTRSESVSQCTVRSHCRATRGTECPITRVILVCNKPAPCCQGVAAYPRRITSRRWSHLRTHMLLMEYHLCFAPCTDVLSWPPRLTCSTPLAPSSSRQPLPSQPLSLYIRLIRPWLSRRPPRHENSSSTRAPFLSVFFFFSPLSSFGPTSSTPFSF